MISLTCFIENARIYSPVPRCLRKMDAAELKRNFEENCIPLSLLQSETMGYDDFLKERRVLMARKMKKYFQSLGEIEIETESV